MQNSQPKVPMGLAILILGFLETRDFCASRQKENHKNLENPKKSEKSKIPSPMSPWVLPCWIFLMSRGFRYFAQETSKKNSLENLKRKQKQPKKTKKHKKKLPDPWVHRAETFVLVFSKFLDFGQKTKKKLETTKKQKKSSQQTLLELWVCNFGVLLFLSRVFACMY